MFQAFDVGAFHYLVKPFEGIKFEEVLKNAAKQIEDRKNKESESTKHVSSLVITAGGRHIAVNPEDIVYAESGEGTGAYRKAELPGICETISALQSEEGRKNGR